MHLDEDEHLMQLDEQEYFCCPVPTDVEGVDVVDGVDGELVGGDGVDG